MEKYLVYSDGDAHKFWSIRTEGSAYTVVFGRVGTAGQTQTKRFVTDAEALAQAEKQVAAKLKKGYEAGQPPAPEKPPARAEKAPPQKAASQKAADDPAAQGPAPVQDDGAPKPWHTEGKGYWSNDAYLPEEDAFTPEALGSPAEAGLPAPAAEQAPDPAKKYRYWAPTFGAECQEKPLAERQQTFEEAEQAGAAKATLQEALDEGVYRILRFRLHANGLQTLPWLLERGGTLRNPEDLVNPYAKQFYGQYTQLGDPYAAAQSLAAFLDTAYDGIAQRLAEGLVAVAAAMQAGTLDEQSGVARLPTTQELAAFQGFRLHVDRERYYIYLEGRQPGTSLFWGKWPDTESVDKSVALQYMPQKLRPLVERLGAEGAFDALGTPGVRVTIGDELLFSKVLDEQAQAQRLQAAEAKVQRLEATEDFEADTPLLKEAVELLLDGPLERDVPRASALLGRFLYSLNETAEDEAIALLGKYADECPAFRYDRGLWRQANGSYVAALDEMQRAHKGGYAPAAEKLREFAAHNAGREAGMPQKQGRPTQDRVEWKTFTEEDVFVNTQNILARAYQSGSIRIRFKVEGEAGYSQALDFVNALLEKGYNRLHRGFSLQVRFVAKPRFIKGLPHWPETSCHAFFAGAVQYPALREKVRRYAELALVPNTWYLDMDGEDSTLPGSFAAAALALCEQQYIPLASQLARSCDGQHQELQLQLAPALVKRYGAVPAVVPAVFDLCASNEYYADMGRLSKELYLLPENLQAVLQHLESGAYTEEEKLPNLFVYVRTLMNSIVKSNLKKLKEPWLAAQSPEDKKIFADFYNLYKGYVSAEDSQDYGEDLVNELVGEVALPVYTEEPPVLVAGKDFKKKYPNTEIGIVYPAARRAVLFIPPVVDDPCLLDHLFTQWWAMRLIARDMPVSCLATPCIAELGGWVVNLYGPAKAWGVVLCGKTGRPTVLYGILNLTELVSRFKRRSFKTPEEAETGRLACLVDEAPDYQPPAPGQEEVFARCAAATGAMLNDRYYAAGKLLEGFTPADGRVYDAALLLRARLAGKLQDPARQRAAYQELADRRPEFAAYCDKQLKAL